MANPDIKVLRSGDGINQQISGKIAFAATKGLWVRQDPASIAGKSGAFDDSRTLIVANNEPGWLLERDVINDTAIPLDQIVFNTNLETPDLINTFVTARKVELYEVEGSELLDSSLDASTVLDCPVKVTNGKLAEALTEGDVIVGYVRGKLAPLTASNTTRFVIEVADGKKLVPAA